NFRNMSKRCRSASTSLHTRDAGAEWRLGRPRGRKSLVCFSRLLVGARATRNTSWQFQRARQSVASFQRSHLLLEQGHAQRQLLDLRPVLANFAIGGHDFQHRLECEAEGEQQRNEDHHSTESHSHHRVRIDRHHRHVCLCLHPANGPRFSSLQLPTPGDHYGNYSSGSFAPDVSPTPTLSLRGRPGCPKPPPARPPWAGGMPPPVSTGSSRATYSRLSSARR